MANKITLKKGDATKYLQDDNVHLEVLLADGWTVEGKSKAKTSKASKSSKGGKAPKKTSKVKKG